MSEKFKLNPDESEYSSYPALGLRGEEALAFLGWAGSGWIREIVEDPILDADETLQSGSPCTLGAHIWLNGSRVCCCGARQLVACQCATCGETHTRSVEVRG